MIRSPLVRSLLVPLALLTLPLQAQEKAAWPKSPRDPEAILRGLGQGIEALQAIGAHDEAERVARIARELKQKIASERERAEERERAAAEERAAKEARVAHSHELDKQELELLAIGVKELANAGWEKGAHELELALHAGKLSLAQRTDDEARRIIAQAPPREAQAKWLATAAELAHRANRSDRAEVLEKASKHWLATARATPARKQEPHADEIGALAEDLRRMQAQLAALQARLDKLMRQPR